MAISAWPPSAVTSSSRAAREFWYCSIRARSSMGTAGRPLSSSVGIPGTGFKSAIFETAGGCAADWARSSARISMVSPQGQRKRRSASSCASAKAAAAYPLPGSSGKTE